MMIEAGRDALARRIVELVDLVAQKAPGYLIDQYKNGELLISKGLPSYLDANYSKCETVRTLLKRDAPTSIASVYEAPRFQVDSKVINEDDLIKRVGVHLQKTIVSGMAGSGKSMFLKHLFREAVERGMTYYPIFFELRSLTQGEQKSLLESLYDSIKLFADDFTDKQFKFGLRRGLFFIMIDALDEASPETRGVIEDSIVELSRKYPKCPLIVTSRPSDSFRVWEGFHTAHLLPFTKEQCLSFIRKIDFSEERKSEFIEALNAKLFDEHSDFLSNPLLASMMLLTFDEFGEIPARRHVFYDKCFQVLLKEHDSSKGRYRRSFQSGLGFSDFEQVFMMFCVLSYLDRKFVFKETEFLEVVQAACSALGISANITAVASDFVNAASVIQKDGGHYEFAHRSFQEYFFARFVVSDREHALIDKIKEISDRSSGDDTIGMVADMNRSYFEKDFVLPISERLLKLISGVDVSSKPDFLISKFFMNVRARPASSDEQVDAEEEANKLWIVYSVSHDDQEYPKRAMNLVLLDYLWSCGHMNNPELRRRKISDDEILSIFGAKQFPKTRTELSIKINFRNRAKLIALGLDVYALKIESALTAAVEKIRRSQSAAKSSLAQKIRTRR